MNSFAKFNFLISILQEVVSWSQQQLLRRFGVFQKLPGILLTTEFALKQISKIDQITCAKKCYFDKKCISFAYGNLLCILYSTDPRARLNETSLIRTNDSPLTMFIVSADTETPCYVGNIPARSYSDLEKCGFEEKMTDSNCAEWSKWKPVFDTLCDGRAHFIWWRTRATNCTQPLFGGKTGICTEKQEKAPLLLDHWTTSFSVAYNFCADLGKDLFTG